MDDRESDWPDAEEFEWKCSVHAQEKEAEINRINALEIAFGNLI